MMLKSDGPWMMPSPSYLWPVSRIDGSDIWNGVKFPLYRRKREEQGLPRVGGGGRGLVLRVRERKGWEKVCFSVVMLLKSTSPAVTWPAPLSVASDETVLISDSYPRSLPLSFLLLREEEEEGETWLVSSCRV